MADCACVRVTAEEAPPPGLQIVGLDAVLDCLLGLPAMCALLFNCEGRIVRPDVDEDYDSASPARWQSSLLLLGSVTATGP